MIACSGCGFPQIPVGTIYAGMVCRCWSRYGQQDPSRYGQARELKQLTEDDVRRIVREEIAKALAVHLQGESARAAASIGKTQEPQ